MSESEKITPQDIRAKLNEVQAGVTDQVESARNKMIAGGVAALLLVLLVAFLMGRKGGLRKNTVIEIRRS